MNGRDLTLGVVGVLAVAGLAHARRGSMNAEVVRNDLLPAGVRDDHDLVVTEMQSRNQFWEPTGVGSGVRPVIYRYHTLVATLYPRGKRHKDDRLGQVAATSERRGDAPVPLRGRCADDLVRLGKAEYAFGVTGAFVDESLRGKGIGQALYAAIVEAAGAHGGALTSNRCLTGTELTSADALRVWERLGRHYRVEGEVAWHAAGEGRTGSRATIAEARSTMVGKSVHVFTSLNGEYIGVLEEVFGSPWRGKVRVTSVTHPVGFTYDRPDRPRVGYEIGEFIEAGGSSIRLQPAPQRSLTYLDALRRDLEQTRRLLASEGAEKSKSYSALLFHAAQAEKEIAFRERAAALPAELAREILRIGTKQRADEKPSDGLVNAGLAQASPWGPKLTSDGWRMHNIVAKLYPAWVVVQREAVIVPVRQQRPRLGILAAPVAAPAPEPTPQPQAPRRPVLLSDFIIKKRGSSNKWSMPADSILQMVGRYIKSFKPGEVPAREVYQQVMSTEDLNVGRRTWMLYSDVRTRKSYGYPTRYGADAIAKDEWKELVSKAKSAGFAANKAGLYGSRALLSASGLSKLTDAELEDYWESLNPSMRNTEAWKLAVTERNVREYRLPNGPAYAAFKAKRRSGSRGSRALVNHAKSAGFGSRRR